MANEYLNISRIEDWFYSRLRGVVSSNVYAGSLPTTLSDDVKDMVVIDVVRVYDGNDIGRESGNAVVNIIVYIKPNSTGKKNVSKFNAVETQLAELADMTADAHYSLSEMYSDSGRDTSIGYDYKIIALKVNIY